MSKTYYPVALDLDEKSVLVVGGGTIATDKVKGLLAAGARVVIVSPKVSDHLASLAVSGRIRWEQRVYETEDLDGIFLAYGATDDLALNARVADEARSRGILVNAVDDPPNCDFFAMAILRRGDLQLAISTNGHSPAFARWLREYLDTAIPHEYAELVTILSEVRSEIRQQGPIPVYRHWKHALSGPLVDELQRGNGDRVRQHIRQVLSDAQEGAAVAAGPARWGD